LPNPIKEKIATYAGTSQFQGMYPGGTINIDLNTRQIHYFLEGIASNFNFNFRSSSSATLASSLDVNEAISCTIFVLATSTFRSMTAPVIDGSTSGVSVYSYTGPGYVSAAGKVESYTFSIIRTGASTYTILTSQSEAGPI
jgi:hypothetical protein